VHLGGSRGLGAEVTTDAALPSSSRVASIALTVAGGAAPALSLPGVQAVYELGVFTTESSKISVASFGSSFPFFCWSMATFEAGAAGAAATGA
jgi:hypothetical protein